MDATTCSGKLLHGAVCTQNSWGNSAIDVVDDAHACACLVGNWECPMNVEGSGTDDGQDPKGDGCDANV